MFAVLHFCTFLSFYSFMMKIKILVLNINEYISKDVGFKAVKKEGRGCNVSRTW